LDFGSWPNKESAEMPIAIARARKEKIRFIYLFTAITIRKNYNRTRFRCSNLRNGFTLLSKDLQIFLLDNNALNYYSISVLKWLALVGLAALRKHIL
jgi:hypothetical protein